LPPLATQKPTGALAALAPAQWIGGAFVALVTPFNGARLAKTTFADFISWQIDEGARGLVTGGAIGEAATLSPRERITLVEIAVATAAGRAPVIAATGTNCTSETIELTRAAQAAGAAAALVVAPYYSRPGQEGLFRHYCAIARAASLPLLIENDPARTAIDILPHTMARLAEIPNIVGVADWGAETRHPRAPGLPAHFVTLSCEDSSVAPFRMAGGRGALSIVANLAPRLTAELHRAADSADWPRAAALQRNLRPLLDALRLEDGPGPLKYALSLLRPGFSPHMRLPLVPIRYETASAIVASLMELNLPT
jgi:4-hydroxy-tetrahydrodipicolinate synthase